MDVSRSVPVRAAFGRLFRPRTLTAATTSSLGGSTGDRSASGATPRDDLETNPDLIRKANGRRHGASCAPSPLVDAALRVVMTAAVDVARGLILSGVRAGRYDAPVDPTVARAIADGTNMPLERLGFDSLGWMEFCISIEVNSGLELSPEEVADMTTLGDIEAWLSARLPA